MTETLPDAQSKPGLILKAAREEISLTIEHVANELHLRPAVVKAIEEENYDEFTSDVFLKGYFRTYCRLVNLHETRMMELLEQQLTARQTQIDHIKQLANKEAQSKKRKKLFITLSVFLICLILVAFAYQIANQSNEESPTVQDLNTQSNLNIIDNSEQNDLKTQTEVIPTERTDINDPEEKPHKQTVTESLVSSNDQISNIQDNTEVINDSSEPLNSLEQADLDNIQELDESSINEKSLIILTSLKASFTGDCWFKVSDSSGKAIIAALKKSDDEINIKGSAPFNIVIGDASKVTLFFQDELVNLKPFTSQNGRAELTLKPSESNNEG
ncbi:MAG: cytoskeleton protein RodZ [Oleiphilaceae bacterium]|jgi:cytoskeletal protein RodZ